jgi:hypothetical protein
VASQKKLSIRAGIAAYGASELLAWKLMLTSSGATTFLWDVEGVVPALSLDVWFVVLSPWIPPLSRLSWLQYLTAPTLLVCPQGQLALQASEIIPYPVLVSSPALAWNSFHELIEILLDIGRGRVWLDAEGAPYTLAE